MHTEPGTGSSADSLAGTLRWADSPSWAQRAAAGRRLARRADLDDIRPLLERLLLDADDTGVTQETARALLERHDLPGLRAVLAALSRAEALCTADQLAGEVDGYRSCVSAAGRGDELRRRLTTLASDTDTDTDIRDEARTLLGPGNHA
ncbi:hypothetical protein LHJ74_16175 [Streptomyces sp. N2-109]|uniref:Uncharacterized protein n=1 Tax=Streptomyces gossypii TaxID=2883101 RepID=A0ABT2JUS6_9ACTN|nr:hypothetical protein [Streptomyces gossypii]MCT2591423.1 hypothetical protein [Streptomyces gossypii]